MRVRPDPSNTAYGSSSGVASGALYLLFAEEGQTADLDITLAPDALNAGDNLRISFVVPQSQGAGLSLYHGPDLVQALTFTGLYSIDHIALSDSRLIRFRAHDPENPVSHAIGGISIEINP